MRQNEFWKSWIILVKNKYNFMESEDFLLDSYDYDLPEDVIAQVPAQPAESAKLLVFSQSDSSIQDYHFYDLPNLLSVNDILVCNNTKVFKARIPLNQTKIIRKSWQERYINGEIFVYQLLHDGRLECLVSDDKNFKPWAEVFLDEEKWISLTSDEYAEDGIIFSVKWIWIFDFLEMYGQMPLPPYIRYEKEKEKRYQTTFAQDLGSAAAPTASLHFSQKLLSDLCSKWVEINFTTLHVGLGTFKPVYESDIRKHKIHREPIIIENSLFQQIYERKYEKKNLIAVWTTMVRLLETLPYLRTSLSSWEKESILPNVEAFHFRESLTSDIHSSDYEKYVHDVSLQQNRIICETQLFIFPGWKFCIIDEMITNFHLPKSSLLMLISALMGRKNALQSYEHAKQNGYHFYSFWDWMRIRK